MIKTIAIDDELPALEIAGELLCPGKFHQPAKKVQFYFMLFIKRIIFMKDPY